VDAVRCTQTPDANVGRDPRRSCIEEGALRAPNLQPPAGSHLVVVIVILRLGPPADSTSGCSLEHLLRNLAVVVKPPIESHGEAVAQEGEHPARVQGKGRAQGPGIPEREADADTPMAPPAHHGSPSRKTNPTPRTVWMSFVGAS